MPMIELRTLGAVDLRSAEGLELHTLLAQPKRLALLAYLCIAQPRGYHRRDTLLALFWPNADQEHARTSLRKSLHILRRALGDDAVLSRGDDEVRVDFDRVSCDAVTFENAVKGNRLEEALELYRGDLLSGFFIDEAPEFEQWLHAERTRLRSAAAMAAQAAAEQHETKGDLASAIIWARRSLELADTDERALRKLLELQWKAGDRVAATESFEVFARHLAVEYETQPSSETRALVDRIRLGAEPPERAPDRKPVPGHTAPGVVGSPMTSVAAGSRSVAYAAAGAVAILLSLAVIWGLARPSKGEQVVRYTLAIDSTENMAELPSWSGRLAISADGGRLAYIGGPGAQLLIRPRNQLRASTIPGTEGAQSPFFSPDGESVGFLTERRVHIAVKGGPVIVTSDSPTGVAGASWARDGFIYVDGGGYVGLLRIEAKPNAVPKWFTTLDTASGEIDHTWPEVLPNGKGVIFAVTFTGTHGVRDSLSYAIAVGEIPSGKHRIIVRDAKYARYSPSGHLLYVTTDKTLTMVPFDQNSMTVTGEPTALIDGMRLGRFGSADLAVSATGTLVYAIGGGQGMQELVWVDRDGSVKSVDPDWRGDIWTPALSPDGKRVAVARRIEGQSVDIWVKQLDRGPSIKLTTATEGGASPAWTPDSRFVTYESDWGGLFGLWTVKGDGSAQPVLQLHQTPPTFRPIWSAGGKWLISSTAYSAPDSGDIVGIRPGLDTAPVQLVATKFREMSPSVSPDDHWLAYSSSESGRDEIYVVPFPDTHGGKWAVSTKGGNNPLWSHSGRELFYQDGAHHLVAAEVETKPGFSVRRETSLFSTAGFTMFRGVRQFAVSPDDRRFLMVRLAPAAPVKLIVVDNWFEELKAKHQK